MKRKALLSGFFAVSSALFAFEWPQKNTNLNSIVTPFGQKKETSVSSSIILYEKPPKDSKEAEEFISEVYACHSGTVTCILTDFEDDNDFFPSTLGNAVILDHGDNLVSVYGNLSEINEIPARLSEAELIGKTGNSAWTTVKNALEFQINDNKNKTAVNPRFILPRMEKEPVNVPSEIVLENKDGKRYEYSQDRVFASGVYRIYQKRNEKNVPARVTVSLNGEISDVLVFDTLRQDNSMIKISGNKKKYSGKELYPDNKLFLSGEIRLTPGKSVLTIENRNHLDDKRTSNFSITAY